MELAGVSWSNGVGSLQARRIPKAEGFGP